MSQELNIRLSMSGGAQVTATIRQVQNSIATMAGKFAAIGGAALGIGSIGGLGLAAVAGAKHIARLGGELNDLQNRTGISVERLTVLQRAFADTGIGADEVGKTFSKLQKSIYDAATVGGPAADALNNLGLSAANLARLSPEEQFNAVSKAVAGIESPTQRAAAAMELFGRSGGQMLQLFGDAGAISKAEEVLGRLPELLGRNAPVLDDISDSIDRLPQKSNQFFAGVADQLAPMAKAILDTIEKIDFTGPGERFGAFVKVAIGFWQEGRFDEFIGATIEEGFRVGGEFAKGAWQRLWDTLTAKSVANAIGNAIVTGIADAAKAVVDLWETVKTFAWAGITWLIGNLVIGFQHAFRTLRDLAADWINFQISGVEKLVNKLRDLAGKDGVSLGRVSKSSGTGPSAMSFDEALGLAQQATEAIGDKLKAGIDLALAGYRSLFGIATEVTTESGKTSEKWKEIIARIAAFLAGRRASGSGAKPANTNTDLSLENTKLELTRQEFELKEKIRGIQEKLLALSSREADIQNDFRLTDVEKFDAKRKLLDEQRRLLLEERSLVEDRVNRLGDVMTRPGLAESDRTAIQGQLTGAESDLLGVQGKLDANRKSRGAMGPDPSSFSEQWGATMTKLNTEWGSWAQQTARAFSDVFNSAIASISDGITGLIMGTKTWGQALMAIGTSILTSIVQAIVQMGVRWVATQLMMAAVGQGISSGASLAAVGTAAATGAAISAAMAAPAALMSIATEGEAAFAGAAAVFEAVSSVQAGMIGMSAYSTGGFTGTGNSSDVAGLVHRNEYVFSAPAVERIGLDTLEAMHRGAAPSSSPTSGGGGNNVAIASFDSRLDAKKWAESQDAETWFVDMATRTAHRWKGRS